MFRTMVFTDDQQEVQDLRGLFKESTITLSCDFKITFVIFRLFLKNYAIWNNTVTTGWRGGLVVGRRTCDLVVAGSRPGRDAAA